MTIMVASPWQAGPRWARVAGGDESWLLAVPRSLGRQRVRRHSEHGAREWEMWRWWPRAGRAAVQRCGPRVVVAQPSTRGAWSFGPQSASA